MPRTDRFTVAGSRISPATNSISFATSFSRLGAPRELSSSTRTACPTFRRAFTSAEPMKPLPPVTNIELTRVTPRFPVWYQPNCGCCWHDAPHRTRPEREDLLQNWECLAGRSQSHRGSCLRGELLVLCVHRRGN